MQATKKSAMILGVALSVGLAGSAQAGDASVVHDFAGSFDDASFSVESAIISHGLVIDYVSHTGAMLARTGEDVGSDVTLFDNADIFIFCSAVVSRKVMEANPMNIAHCPYGVFVAEREGRVMVGYRTYPEGPMQEVQSLLASIVDEAIQ